MADAFVIGAVGFAGYAASSALLLRYVTAAPPPVIVMACAVVVYPLTLLSAGMFAPGSSFWELTAAYAFGTVSYLMVFGAVYKSISLRILADLAAAPARCDDYDAVAARYVQRSSFEDRLQVMVSQGFVTFDGTRYALTPRGSALAGVAGGLQRTFGIVKSG